ncbi:hypothetical protein AB6A40_009755 [Gnathostoma spinigerum]|uniref:Uncharacterized protein n=1 Tax=Gnathostoma spinigerum TaxID=75299 RepID=A0ABD6ET65_9BILA
MHKRHSPKPESCSYSANVHFF